MSWGFNYFRQPLSAHQNFKKNKPSKKEFYNLLNTTIHKVNALDTLIKKHPADIINREINKCLAGELKEKFSISLISSKRIKTFLSHYLAITSWSGVSLPFLMEAHIATDLFYFERPFINAHEKSHLKGFARESEANFLAYLTCRRSSIPLIRYSAHFAILKYLFISLPLKQKKIYWRKMNKPVQKKFKRIRKRYMAKSKFLRSLTRAFYKRYLKTNRIKKGMRNYHQVIQLILRYRDNNS